jgi:prepilin peptidase CpaA
MADPLRLGFALVFALLLALAMAEDARRLIIPNWISAALVAAFALFAWLYLAPPAILQHLAIAAVFLAITIAFWLPGWFGGGDAKLLSAVGLWMGPANAVPFLIVLAVVAAVMSAVLVWIRRRGDQWHTPSLPHPVRHMVTVSAKGICPYGVAIGIAALVRMPALF